MTLVLEGCIIITTTTTTTTTPTTSLLSLLLLLLLLLAPQCVGVFGADDILEDSNDVLRLLSVTHDYSLFLTFSYVSAIKSFSAGKETSGDDTEH